MADTSLTLWLNDAGSDAGALVGGKFSSLAEMSQAGFGVPPAFAVTTASYRAFLEHHRFADELAAVKAVDRDDLDAVDRVSAAITHAIEHAELPAEVREAIRVAYASLCERTGSDAVPVAVRSSGVAEDLAGASFAGQYETYLWIVGIDSVLEHVRRCWAGLFGPAVLTYHPTDADFHSSELGMAVVVQEMVRPRAAGVAFTLDPVSGDRSKIVVEAAWGLGEAVVGGEVTPDRYRVDKVTLEILERTIIDKPLEYRFEVGSGVQLREVPADRRNASSLTDTHLTELATLAKRIERHRGAPQDIEWAVDETDKVHVLQVRPETVWSQRERESTAVSSNPLDHVFGTFMGGFVAPKKDDA